MTLSKHACYLDNDPNSTDPPEYFIPGATSVPVIRGKYTKFRESQPLDNRRRAIKTFCLNDSVDLFASLLFSNEVFSIDFYDAVKIISLIDESIDKFNYNELNVHLRFFLDDDGSYSLRHKRFLNHDYHPFCFENNISSVVSVICEENLNQSNANTLFKTLFKNRFQLTDCTTKKRYTETIYLAEHRFYIDVTVNCDLNDAIVPLVIAYDEFGVLYTDYYYDHQYIAPYILKAIKPSFDEKIVNSDYFNQNETNALKMLWM